jgi:hypothetical protein
METKRKSGAGFAVLFLACFMIVDTLHTKPPEPTAKQTATQTAPPSFNFHKWLYKEMDEHEAEREKLARELYAKEAERERLHPVKPDKKIPLNPELNAAVKQFIADKLAEANGTSTTAKKSTGDAEDSTNSAEIEDSVKEFGGGSSFLDSGNNQPSGKPYIIIGTTGPGKDWADRQK